MPECYTLILVTNWEVVLVLVLNWDGIGLTASIFGYGFLVLPCCVRTSGASAYSLLTSLNNGSCGRWWRAKSR